MKEKVQVALQMSKFDSWPQTTDSIAPEDGRGKVAETQTKIIGILWGRSSSIPDKSQRSSSMSVSPDRVRVRGRSPAFTALAASFENPKDRNLSFPPPMTRELYPKSMTPDSAKLAPKSAAIAQLLILNSYLQHAIDEFIRLSYEI